MSSPFRCATRITINCIAAAMSAPFGRGTGFVDPLKYAARLWEASRDQRNGATASGNGTLDPDLEAEFSEPYLRKGSGAAARST